ncbi:MAG: DUF418 domain-containing protein [Acidobacteriia bacterium]|nr:DUF418 domain-containing protein [Terriglobia bacterium]
MIVQLFPGHYTSVASREAGSAPPSALTFFHAASIVLLFRRPAWIRAMEPFRWMGRLGLSNYILASLLTTTVFRGYGWDSFRDLEAWRRGRAGSGRVRWSGCGAAR